MSEDEAKVWLLEVGGLKPGDTIWTVLRSVASSGMSRRLDLYVIRDNVPRRLTYHVAKALGWRYNKQHEQLVVSGCGMDMGFHTVYSLSAVLFSDHVRGGYALEQRWL